MNERLPEIKPEAGVTVGYIRPTDDVTRDLTLKLSAAELKVKAMEKLLREGIAAADTSHTNPRRLFVWQDAAKAHLAEPKR